MNREERDEFYVICCDELGDIITIKETSKTEEYTIREKDRIGLFATHIYQEKEEKRITFINELRDARKFNSLDDAKEFLSEIRKGNVWKIIKSDRFTNIRIVKVTKTIKFENI